MSFIGGVMDWTSGLEEGEGPEGEGPGGGGARRGRGPEGGRPSSVKMSLCREKTTVSNPTCK